MAQDSLFWTTLRNTYFCATFKVQGSYNMLHSEKSSFQASQVNFLSCTNCENFSSMGLFLHSVEDRSRLLDKKQG